MKTLGLFIFIFIITSSKALASPIILEPVYFEDNILTEHRIDLSKRLRPKKNSVLSLSKATTVSIESGRIPIVTHKLMSGFKVNARPRGNNGSGSKIVASYSFNF